MTRTIRTIIGGIWGFTAGLGALALASGFCSLFEEQLGKDEWWVSLLAIGIPFLTGLIVGVSDDDWDSAWGIFLAPIGAALATCVLLLVIFIIGLIYYLVTTATFADWMTVAAFVGILSAPVIVVVLIFGG